MNKKIPTLLLPSGECTESSSDENIHECIRDMNIKYNIKPNNNNKYDKTISTASSSDLKFYNKLYHYKKNLAKRNIEFFMTDTDLIDINNDNSNPLQLRI